MNALNTVIFCTGLLLILSCIARVDDSSAGISIPAFQGRKNRTHLRLGSHYMKQNDRTDLWNLDKETLVGLGVEFGYERILFGFVGCEVSAGVTKSAESWGRTLFPGDWDKIELFNFYGSQDFKVYLPIGQKAALFTGAGYDIFCDSGEIRYTSEDGLDHYSKNDSTAFGGHIQAGFEVLILDSPEMGDHYDWPVSLEIKYSHLWVGFDDVDQHIISSIKDLDEIFSRDFPSPVEGHMVSIGFKWHF